MPTCQCASRCDVVQLKHTGWPYIPVTIFGSTHTGSTHTVSDVLLTPVPQGRGKRELAITVLRTRLKQKQALIAL